jgi:hypothetical protein
MLHDLFAWLIATFVIAPVQAEFASRMQAAQVPAAIIRQVEGCVVGAAPVLIDRATGNPWWGLTTTIGVAAGYTDAKAILAEASPACAAAVAAVRPFLESPRV